MEYDEAFWRIVDVANLKRRVAEAKDTAARVDGKIENAEAHLAAAKAAKDDALDAVEDAEAALAAARESADEIPAELAATVQADVDRRNLVRDASLLVAAHPELFQLAIAQAQTAEATGVANEANGAN